MIVATIYIDDVVYSGIEFGTRDTFIWDGEPKELAGRRNLTSHLERILDRIDDGRLSAKSIRIELDMVAVQTRFGGDR